MSNSVVDRGNFDAKSAAVVKGAKWMQLAIWGSLMAVGVAIALLFPWLTEGMRSSTPVNAGAADFLTRLATVTGVIAIVGGIARLFGHVEQTPSKPIDALGKALSLWAVIFATAYSIVIYWALNR
jgi:hypothetical protein